MDLETILKTQNNCKCTKFYHNSGQELYCQGSLKRSCTIIFHLDGTKFSGALRFGDTGESGAIGECGAIGERGAIGEEGDNGKSTLVTCRP